ncbi:hypothetical protein BH24ACT26_BH24ACT26_06020 [soil metagenome]
MLQEPHWSGTLQTSGQPNATEGHVSVAAGGNQHVPPTMRLWAMDARVRHGAVLTDRTLLRTIMYGAAEAGGATVLGEEFCVFDNLAVTGVLVLAQSHLSIHTWPEFSLANIDLLSYGALQGEAVLRLIARQLDAECVSISCVLRSPPSQTE